jgi:uncharacterized protein (DUF885 family)
MKKRLNVSTSVASTLLVSTLALSGCFGTNTANTASTASAENEVAAQPQVQPQVQTNAKFKAFSEQFIADFWTLNPGYAVYVGYYKHDNQLPIPNAATVEKEMAFFNQQLGLLQAFDPTTLNASDASDYYILKNQIESYIWYNTELKSGEWNPSNYNVAGVFGVILNTDYKPLNERLATITQRMENIPAYYQAAKANLTTPTVTHTTLAIQQNKGALGLFDTIAAKVAESTLSAEQKTAFTTQFELTKTAITGYVSWLETRLPELENSDDTRDFRIGKKLYDKKFQLDIFSGYTAEQLFNKALSEKSRVHSEMTKITDKLWPKYFADTAQPTDKLKAIKTLIDHISVKHVEADNFVAIISAQIPALEAFVLEKNLLAMDKEKPLIVRETPKYQRGFAGASINAPGPYDPEANTYYNVTPLDNMTDEQAESYLREYNHWLLQILNIHEAVPGHYTQLVHSNKSKSLVKSIFGNGAMVEGWAVYTEIMMLEEGYGDFEPELWLMYYKWNLRVIMNSILDYRIQVEGIGETEALDLMVNQAFQEDAEARGKWRRATLSQVQLTSYFTGYSEIYQLREDLKAATGDKFNLTDFHNQFLSYGSSPVPIIRKLMFDDYVKNHS